MEEMEKVEKQKMEEEENEVIEEEIEKIYKTDIFDGSKKLVGAIVTLKCTKCKRVLMRYSIDYPSYKKHLLMAGSCEHYDMIVYSETEFNLLIVNKITNKQEWEQFKKIYLNACREIMIGDKSYLFIPKDN